MSGLTDKPADANPFPDDPVMRAKWRLLRMESAELRARDALIAAEVEVRVARIELERAEKEAFARTQGGKA